MDEKALFKITCGLFILGVESKGKMGGCVVDTVMQATSEPIRAVVIVNHQNETCRMIREKGSLTISVLSHDTDIGDINLFGFHSSKDTDKFTGKKYTVDGLGNPAPDCGANALYYCRVISETDAGTHSVFLVELTGAKVLSESESLTYGYYRSEMRGMQSKRSPSYVENADTKAGDKGKWRCKVCGYIYDGETPFEDLPDTWTCPVCGVPKSEFEMI